MTNGAQAKVFADQYIAAHVGDSIAAAAKSDPKITRVTTYSQLSSLARANPNDKNLPPLVDSVFKGQMLRSSLLSAWGWETMATIMFWVAVFAFGAAGLLVLAGVLLVPALRARVGVDRLVHHRGRPATG